MSIYYKIVIFIKAIMQKKKKKNPKFRIVAWNSLLIFALDWKYFEVKTVLFGNPTPTPAPSLGLCPWWTFETSFIAFN
jgi:hypothetical protein